MQFIIDKESLLNKIKIVEKITALRSIQPVLSNILIEAEGDLIKLSSTDLDISIVTKTIAKIKEEGRITLPAKKLFEIVSKLSDKPIEFTLNEETNIVTIKCGNSKFDIMGISAEEFPRIMQEEDEVKEEEAIIIDSNPFLKSIKYTVYAVANYDNRTVISGVFCQIKEDTIEMAATDGNRLTRISEKIQNENRKEAKIVIPGKTVNEILRVASIISEEKVYLKVTETKIIIKTNSYMIISKLNTGEYPQYQQLIPKTTSKVIKMNKNELINAIDLVSCMVDDKTKLIKLIFQEGKLYLKAETQQSGTSEDYIETDYTGEEFKIAFNYKLINDFLKIIDSEKVIVGLNGNQSATILRPDNEDDYICLVMPMKVQ
jgi:DNA polymerase-3 subunit beta